MRAGVYSYLALTLITNETIIVPFRGVLPEFLLSPNPANDGERGWLDQQREAGSIVMSGQPGNGGSQPPTLYKHTCNEGMHTRKLMKTCETYNQYIAR